jgi:hypothetical protein
MQQCCDRLLLVAAEFHDQPRYRHQMANIGRRGRLTGLIPVKLGRELKRIIKLPADFDDLGSYASLCFPPPSE